MGRSTRFAETHFVLGFALLALTACSDSSQSSDDGIGPSSGSTSSSSPDGGAVSTADGGSILGVHDSGTTTSSDGGSDAAAAGCTGYEPCGVNAVAPPTGYTIASSAGISTSNSSTDNPCADMDDCEMWNTHFSSNWYAAGTKTLVDPYYNRMASPFWWPLSRYIVNTSPKVITYAKLHVVAPGAMFTFPDGTPEMRIDRTSGAKTCFARGAGTLETGQIEGMGGTGDLGVVRFNISLLPGDMGNTGNVSSCMGSGLDAVNITEDETKAAASKNASTGKYGFCLLRPGQTYWVSFMASGKTPSTDCSTAQCSMGGFGFASSFTTSDGKPFTNEIACP